MELQVSTRPFAALAFAAVLVAAPVVRAQDDVLTLDQAIRIALESNPAVASSVASHAAAGYGVDAAVTGFLPQVTASVGYRRATQNSATPDYTANGTVQAATTRTSGTSYDNYSASLGLQQTIWDFGRTLGPYDAARAQNRAAEATVRSTIEDTWLQVGQAYFQAIAARQTVEAAQESKRQMTEHLAAAQGRVDAGLRPRIDVTRAQADLASADLALVVAVNGERTAQIALGTAMGKPGLGRVVLVRPASSEPPGAEDLEASTREAMAGRPELLRLKEQIKAAEAQVAAARGGFFPTLGANAGLTYTGFKVQDLAWNWYVGASLNWGLVSGIVAANATAKESQANVRALKANLVGLENSIRAEVENAEVGWREARDKQAPAQALLAAARETLDLAEARYAIGSGNVTEVADAQATMVQARTSVIQAELEIEVARLKLLRSLGRLHPGT
jgi:outer membrane protein TolC